MTECPACGSVVRPGQGACSACGARLEGATLKFRPVGAETDEVVAHALETEGPVLVVRKGHDVGERFYLDAPETTIGRDPLCDVFLNDVTVSRRHAAVANDAGVVTVRDTGSLNGTYVNGIRVDSAPLSSGDILQVGTFQMVFIGAGVDL